MADKKISLVFGKPEYGWLPVEFKANTFEISFETSDVPVDPIAQLCDTLFLTLKGIDSEVWWYLEPGGYYFSFSCHDKLVNLTISSAPGDESARKLLYEINGDFDSIILPIYKSLQEFIAFHYKDPHWPHLDNEVITKLTTLIKEMGA